jgi:hypothetical protein
MPPCGASLPAFSKCTFTVTYSGALTSSGTMTIALTNSGATQFVVPLNGATTDQPKLQIRGDPGALTWSAPGWGSWVSLTGIGLTSRFDLIVSSYGGAPAEQLAAEAWVYPPFAWGPGGDADAGYPGGVGTVQIGGVTYQYCGGRLDAGEECALTASIRPDAGGQYNCDVRIDYATDAGTRVANKLIEADVDGGH